MQLKLYAFKTPLTAVLDFLDWCSCHSSMSSTTPCLYSHGGASAVEGECLGSCSERGGVLAPAGAHGVGTSEPCHAAGDPVLFGASDKVRWEGELDT